MVLPHFQRHTRSAESPWDNSRCQVADRQGHRLKWDCTFSVPSKLVRRVSLPVGTGTEYHCLGSDSFRITRKSSSVVIHSL